MVNLMITEAMKQTVITRLATINSAISILNLTNGKPAKVTVNEVLDLAERIEHWAWPDLLEEKTDTQAPEKTADLAPPVPPAKIEPEPAAKKGEPPRQKPEPPHPNGDGQHRSPPSSPSARARATTAMK